MVSMFKTGENAWNREMSDKIKAASPKREWNYKPQVPIQSSPLWEWPPSPTKIGKWFATRWMPLTENAVLVVIGLICWTWLTPSLDTMKVLHWEWIGAIWLRNSASSIRSAIGRARSIRPSDNCASAALSMKTWH